MAKKLLMHRSSPSSADARPAVTEDRFVRLQRLLHLLGEGARRREWLIRQLRLDVRGFYRDLEFLRAAGINIGFGENGYSLSEPLDEAITRLPFPDPRLTVGEINQLARGNTTVHRLLKERITRLRS
jgi:hypothetical protein